MEDQVDYDASQEKGTSSRAPDDNRCEQLGTEDASKQRSTRKASLGSLWWIILCSSLLLAEVQASLETTMTADLQLTIINTFGEVPKFPWINVTYSLALGSSCLFW